MAQSHDAGRCKTADHRPVELMRPLVVIEGRPGDVQARLASCLASLRGAGWTIVAGWVAPLEADRIVCTGEIVSTDDARRALLAAIAGAGLVVAASADSLTVDRLVDDLRRLGAVDHVVAGGVHLTDGSLLQCAMPAQRSHRIHASRTCRGIPNWRSKGRQ